MKITSDAALLIDELRLHYEDEYVLSELLRFDHGESIFTLSESARRDMPGASWSKDRFYGALSRLIAKGCMVAVSETIQ